MKLDYKGYFDCEEGNTESDIKALTEAFRECHTIPTENYYEGIEDE